MQETSVTAIYGCGDIRKAAIVAIDDNTTSTEVFNNSQVGCGSNRRLIVAGDSRNSYIAVETSKTGATHVAEAIP